MTISKFTNDVNNIQALPDRPNSNGGMTSAELKAVFDKAGKEIKDYLNNVLIAALESVTEGSSGADQIGSAAILGVTGTTPRAQISDLKNQLNSIIAGEIIPSSIVDEMLSDSPGQAKDRLLRKADITYVDTQISNIGTASPKGVYATLSALQAAFPTGTTGVYVVTADGKWYYWNGFAWTAGGTYQSTGIADGSINPDKTNTEIPNTRNKSNLFIKSAAVLGKYIADSTGAENTLAGFGYFTMPVQVGAYIFVEHGVSYSGQLGAYFDVSGTYLSAIAVSGAHVKNVSNTKRILKVPTGAVTMKINFDSTKIDNLLIYQNGLGLTQDNKIGDEWIKGNVVNKTDTPFISNIMEFLSGHAVLDGLYINSLGALNFDTSFSSISPIPVKQGEVYEVKNYIEEASLPGSYSSRGIYLDSNFKFVSTLPAINARTVEYTVPSGVSYLTVNFQSVMSSALSVRRLSSPSENVLIRKASIYPAIPDAETNGWSGKKWTSFGDSITQQEAWQPYVISKYGLIHTNCGQSSTPVGGSNAFAFWQNVRINAVKAADPNLITILGGANDWSLAVPMGTDAEFGKTLANKDKTTFKGAYSYVIETLLTWKPELRMFILTTMYAYFGAANGTTGLKLSDYAEACRVIARYYGIPVVDLDAKMGLNNLTKSLLTSDDIHPNTAGGKRMAELVIGKLKTINPI